MKNGQGGRVVLGRIVNILHMLLGLIPFSWLVVFYLYVVRAAVVLHKFPAPYRPDPKELGFVWHHAVIGILLEVAFYSAFAWVFLIPFRKFLLPNQPLLFRACFYVVSWILIIWIVWVDPGRFFEWYCD